MRAMLLKIRNVYFLMNAQISVSVYVKAIKICWNTISETKEIWLVLITKFGLKSQLIYRYPSSTVYARSTKTTKMCFGLLEKIEQSFLRFVSQVSKNKLFSMFMYSMFNAQSLLLNSHSVCNQVFIYFSQDYQQLFEWTPKWNVPKWI